MGGDGGCVPQRADMVKTVGYGFAYNLGGQGYLANTIIRISDDKVGSREARRIWMSTCRLTNEPLKEPVVCDRLGSLFNKEAILTMMMTKRAVVVERFPHISKLKDLKDVKAHFTEGTSGSSSSGSSRTDGFGSSGALHGGFSHSARGAGRSAGSSAGQAVGAATIGGGPADLANIGGAADGKHLVCPITTAELDDGVTKAVCLWNCGCLLARKALSAMTKADKIAGPCPSCGQEGSLGGSWVSCAPDEEERKNMMLELPEKTRLKIQSVAKAGSKKRGGGQGGGGGQEAADEEEVPMGDGGGGQAGTTTGGGSVFLPEWSSWNVSSSRIFFIIPTGHDISVRSFHVCL